jgi:hypothetical protein
VARLLGVRLHDINCAFKLIRAEAVADLPLLEATDFTVNAELILAAQHAGMRIVEVDVTHRPRLTGRSTVGVLDIVPTLRGLLALRRRMRARRH